MSSTYSPDLRIELIGTGDQAGVWGNTTNTNLGTVLEQAIAGYTSVSIASSDQALTVYNGASDQSRCAAVALTTLTSANFNVYIPPSSKLYVINNASAYVATIYCSTVAGNTTAKGTGISVPAGKTMALWTDGTNVYQQANNFVSVTLASPTITSPTVSNGTFTSPSLVSANLGTPAAGVMTNVTGLPLSTAVTGILAVANGGTGSNTATGTGNVVLSNSPTLVTPSLGTPASGVLTNCTGTAAGLSIGGNAATATAAASLATTNFSIVESGGALLVKYQGTTVASIDSTGVITSQP